MAAFPRVTPLHGNAGCSSASPLLAKCELQSHTRGVFHSLCCRRAVAVSTNSLLEDRARATAPDAWLRAPPECRKPRLLRLCPCAHGQRVEEKGNIYVQTLRPEPWHNRQSPNRRTQ